MNYPQDLEAKLGFDKIKSIIKEYCVSSMGADFVDKLSFSTQAVNINQWQDQTCEFMRILSLGGGFPETGYDDISSSLKQSQIPGNYLDIEALFEIKGVLDTMIKISDFFQLKSEDYPILSSRFESIILDYSLHEHLVQKIDEKGELRDNASPELMAIRESIHKSQIKARAAVNKILKSASSSGYCPEDASLTIREGRLVIPVLAEHKRHIRGFVHDESATGQTVFLEPAEALEINNEVRELKYAERREIIRILTRMTDHVRENREGLTTGLKMLGVLDFIKAKAKFGLAYHGICPKVFKEPMIDWKQARHPILEQSLRDHGKSIIPLDIKLHSEDRILLISGPNAGGKSVALKTIGLIQYMLQCGLPVPVVEGSQFGTFGALFIDIGDEQSIENDLSTYSSHLTNMKFFLENANRKTLFLIDEFGTGTEPQFGEAIAETVLFELNKSGAFGAITTHYGNLKKMAENQKGIVNAAMKFDVKKLEPLYELEIGKPGSSFALEIAGKIGLSRQLLESAKIKAGASHVQFDLMLSELEQEKNEILKERKAVDAKNLRLAEAIKDYEDLKAYMEKQKAKVLKEAKEEAARVIQSSNKKIEATIRQIQESKADKQKTLLAREELKTHREKLDRNIAETAVKKEIQKPVDPIIGIGDKVRILATGAAGEVMAIKGKQVELSLGGLSSRVKLADLEKISSKDFKKTTDERVRQMSGIDLNKKMADFSGTLDIRGVRAEEAFLKVENYMDEAILLGYTEVKILHGKGYGILRDLVRTILKENPKVTSAKDEHVERGGAGITVVTIDS